MSGKRMKGEIVKKEAAKEAEHESTGQRENKL